LYRVAQDVPSNSQNIGKCGDAFLTGLREPSASSTRISQPTKGRGCSPRAPRDRLSRDRGGSDGFFCPLVEIVAEGRVDLALEFKCGDQSTAIDDEDIPKFCGPEVAGQGHDTPNVSEGETIGAYEVVHECDEALHVLWLRDFRGVFGVKVPVSAAILARR